MHRRARAELDRNRLFVVLTMTDPKIEKRMHDMLDAQNAGFAALHQANAAIARSIAAIEVSSQAMLEVVHQHDVAISAAMLANQAAIDVLDAWRQR